MKCPVCFQAELHRETRDQQYTYKGEHTVLLAVKADYCPNCQESITDALETARVMREMNAFHQQVNANLVSPQFIAGIRQKLALGQREAAKLFGGGVNAFSRYENGKTKPPLALVQLFKILDKRPELIHEVRAA